MRLYLVQHGEALAKDIDPERPLSAKGREDAARLGAALARAGVTAGRVLHSGKLRAKQTAEAISAARAAGPSPESSDGLAPNDPVKAFQEKVQASREDAVVVGHLPFMAKLVGLLVAGDEDASIVAFTPGSMVSVERDDNARWHIVWMTRPETLA